jgi:hypothetical protein
MKNPCLSCRLVRADKNNPECRECDARVAYVYSIGDMTHSMPMPTLTKEKKPMETQPVMEEAAEPAKKCNFCGETKPLDGFAKNQTCRDGHEGQCKTCKKERTKLKDKAKAQNKDQRPLPADAPKPPAGRDEKRFIVVDFSSHPDLYEKIKQMAQQEFRNPEQQVLFLIQLFDKPPVKIGGTSDETRGSGI